MSSWKRATRTLERALSLASARMHPIMCVRSHIVFRNPTGKSDRRGSANLVGSAKRALCVYAVVEGPCGTLHSSRRRPRTRCGARRAQDFFGPRQGLRRRHVQSIHVEAARNGRTSRVLMRRRGGDGVEESCFASTKPGTAQLPCAPDARATLFVRKRRRRRWRESPASRRSARVRRGRRLLAHW